MQVQNLQIYSSSIAVGGNGPWIDISNLVSLSVQINTFTTGSTDIEVSNDPNVMIDGAGIGAPSAAPTLRQFAAGSTFQSGVSNLAGGTFFVTTTFITKWGETVASAESSLAVTAGNYLFVAAPTPTAAQAPYVTGWNCYVGLASGAEVLQTAPPYSSQRTIDSTGTQTPLGSGVSGTGGIHFTITGALPLQQNFAMVNGFQQTEWTAPVSDQSGGANSGVSVTNGAGFTTSASDENTTVAVFYSGSNVMWTPSCMTWKFLRVTHGGASTVAYLNGQKG
jgi:hypothetical protein